MYISFKEFLYWQKQKLQFKLYSSLTIMNSVKTLKYIIKHNCSVSRYGDGEFELMFERKNIGFQPFSVELQKKLVSTMESSDKSLLLCIPYTFNSTKHLNKRAFSHWKIWKLRHQKKVVSEIKRHTHTVLFGDSLFSRPYMDYKSPRKTKVIFSLMKKLWDSKDIIIVEGEHSCLGVGNDLFDNANSIKRIVCPSIDAFSKYDNIVGKVIQNYHNEIILIALGPTATILAADLAKLNIQAIDIGHIDIEYEWFKNGATNKVAIPGKYVNEVKNGNQCSDCIDPLYLSQIIDKV